MTLRADRVTLGADHVTLGAAHMMLLLGADHVTFGAAHVTWGRDFTGQYGCSSTLCPESPLLSVNSFHLMSGIPHT